MMEQKKRLIKLFLILEKPTNIQLKPDGFPDMRMKENQLWYKNQVKIRENYLRILKEFKEKYQSNQQHTTQHATQYTTLLTNFVRLRTAEAPIKSTDHAGVIYIYCDQDKHLNEVKIGRSCKKNATNRLHEQIKKFSKPIYKMFETPFNMFVESFIHQELKHLRLKSIKSDPAGKTEWFNCDFEQICDIVEEICKISRILDGPWDIFVHKNKDNLDLLCQNLYYSDFDDRKLNMSTSDHRTAKAKLEAIHRNSLQMYDHIKTILESKRVKNRSKRNVRPSSLPILPDKIIPTENNHNRCQRTTKKGSQCKRNGQAVMNNGGYCWQHI